MSDEDDIPDFLRISADERKATWEANPPKAAPRTNWRTPEQEAAERARLQAFADRKRMAKCVSKQKRLIQSQTTEAVLEDRKAAAEGKKWDVRSARWIDPIEEALKPKEENRKMVQVVEQTTPKKTKKKNEEDGQFGFRKDSNYARMMTCLAAHLNDMVPLRVVAEAAYATSRDLEKHQRRVLAMARKVQEKVLEKRRMSFVIKKERKDNGVFIGLFAK